ncbi:MAG: DUF1552 domain-containing protein [Isosphaeraceae bacterium]
MWLTAAPLQPQARHLTRFASTRSSLSTPGNTAGRPSLVLSDRRRHRPFRVRRPLTPEGRPVPAENSPRRVFDCLFQGERGLAGLGARRPEAAGSSWSTPWAQSARDLNRRLGQSDRERMDQYLASLDEVESRLIASEKWVDVPLKKQDYSHLNLDATNEGDPAEYYRNMFDLIALAFDADITRSVAFMLNREDGMGISDTFPLKLGLGRTHHSLSHATDKEGQLAFAKYDQFLSRQIAGFLGRLAAYRDRDGSVLDHTIVLFGSGASTTHNPRDLPTLVAGGSGLGLRHGQYWRNGEQRMSNLYLSILRALRVDQENFADSTGTLTTPVFARV